MIIDTIDSAYSGAEGIREAFDKSGDILSGFRMVEEKQIVENLFKHINSHTGLGVYGLKEIIKLLMNKVVDTVIITDDTDLNRIEAKCKRCQHIQEEIVERHNVIPRKTYLLNSPCPNCKSMDLEIAEQDLVDYLALISDKTGSKVEVISGKAEHGVMLSSLGKIGAILRYNPGYSAS